MTQYEVIGYSQNGAYAEMIEAPDKDEALKLGEQSMKSWLPKGVKILKWVVRNYWGRNEFLQ